MNRSLRVKMQRRINRGVAWMNSRGPKFWDEYAEKYGLDRSKILNGNWLDLNLDDLDLQDAFVCILGQAGGNFHDVIRFAKLTWRQASELGFFLDEEDYGFDEDEDYEFTSEEYSAFTELWIAKVQQLRADKAQQ